MQERLAGDKQFIILKLDKPSILRKMHFGKYHKAHPCNLKDFKVYGSQSCKESRSSTWVRILRGGLRNDAQPEVFDTRWTNNEGVPFPVRYVKLVPLATHSPNFNFSVWHVALEGISDRYTVERVTNEHQEVGTGWSVVVPAPILRTFISPPASRINGDSPDPQASPQPGLPHSLSRTAPYMPAGRTSRAP